MISVNLNNPSTTANLKLPKTHHSIPQMALRVHLLFPKFPPQPLKSRSNPFPSSIYLLSTTPKKIQISSKKSSSDAELASDLAAEVEKINTLLVQKEDAMKKSREILFTELCKHMGMRDNEVKKKWKKMNEDEKWVLVKGFVLEWGANFHPLSAKSVKELVDEYLVEDNTSPSDSSYGSMLFPNLKKIMGFS